MDRILDAGFKQPAGESVLDPERLARGERSRLHGRGRRRRRGLSKLDGRPERPLAARRRQRRPDRRDGHAALVEFEIRGDADEAADKIDPVLDRVDEAAAGPPGALHRRVRRRERGQRDRDGRSPRISSKAGLLSLPITLIILVIAFGALVAAGIPLLLALTAVFATFGLVALPSQLLPMAHRGVRASCS